MSIPIDHCNPSTSSIPTTTTSRSNLMPEIHYAAAEANARQHPAYQQYGYAQPPPHQNLMQNLQVQHRLPPASNATMYGALPPNYYPAQHPLRPTPVYPGYPPYHMMYPTTYPQETYRGSGPSLIPPLEDHQLSQFHQPTADYSEQELQHQRYENLRAGFSETSEQTTALDLSARHREVTLGK
ncbi:unnamed protein product [Spodoptera littoralis]|uniref:Uncharacterized protein n=1 Tax=Spodoptera littoralis TaxID=7109 RepID=A0A9P0IHY6_SPOLI|nr:unnamed protein product [Spodoptera littoralis]